LENNQLNFFHVGITVDNLERAIHFFTSGLNCELKSTRKLSGDYLRQVIGDERIHSAEIALLDFTNGTTLELVEYDEKIQEDQPNLISVGSYHIAHFVTNMEECIQNLFALGCKLLGEEFTKIPSGPYAGNRIVFLATPLNIILELIELDTSTFSKNI
jgi:catechol 2,3-dioxygenase-like lactoylglutathione lyase family enzyme